MLITAMCSVLVAKCTYGSCMDAELVRGVYRDDEVCFKRCWAAHDFIKALAWLAMQASWRTQEDVRNPISAIFVPTLHHYWNSRKFDWKYLVDLVKAYAHFWMAFHMGLSASDDTRLQIHMQHRFKNSTTITNWHALNLNRMICFLHIPILRCFNRIQPIACALLMCCAVHK